VWRPEQGHAQHLAPSEVFQRLTVTAIRNLAMTVTLSERSATKVALDEPTREPAQPPRSDRAGEELMKPICADVPPTALRWSPSVLPFTCRFATCSFRVGF